MSTEFCELVACGYAPPHRIVWSGRLPILLDHGEADFDLEFDLEAELVLLALGGSGSGCIARVHTWLAREADDIGLLVGRSARAGAVGQWQCAACGDDPSTNAMSKDWEAIATCYFLHGRATRAGWLRVSRSEGSLGDVGLVERRHHMASGHPATFVRSKVKGLTAHEMVRALRSVRDARPRRTYADAAAILARLSPTDIAAIADGEAPPSLLQATSTVEAA